VFNISQSNHAFAILKKLQTTTRLYGLAADEGHIRLEQTHGFGTNPGNLRMFSSTPASATELSALVVVLHGCGQTAAGYDHGAGWSTLADRYGFALLMPEQQRSNNPNGCFNWFQPEDTQRGRGEAESIRQMVEKMVRDDNIDPRRVFVTGLSAGGAMTSVMLACYPEVFAAGAIIAGLPYGAASSVQQAFESMFQCPPRAREHWGDLVRAAAPLHQGSWPRVSVWHGNADRTVVPSNAREILKQWTEIHGLPNAPTKEVMLGDYSRQVWLNEAGDELVESYNITHMAHGTPLATGRGDFECGAAGPFLLDVGISSSSHIAKFFGLTAAGARLVSTEDSVMKSAALLPLSKIPELEQPQILHGEILEEATPGYESPGRPSLRINIGAVITKALQTAGLINR
jgi:poly(hydroxyalkanoate) depolymerase family esterase